MVFKWYAYHIVTITIFVIVLILFGYIFKHRKKLGANYFLGILSMVLLWSIAQGLEFSVLDIKHKLIFANIQYIPIMIIPVLYLYLAASFLERDKLLNNKYLPFILLIIPIILNILIWTDSAHGLIRQDIHLELEGIVPTISKKFGLTMLPFAIYNFSITIITISLLLKACLDKAFSFRIQAGYLLIGLLIPTLTTFLNNIGINFYNIDTTIFGFTATGIFLTYAIFRHGLFDIMPIALRHIINEVKAGFIVYDDLFRIIDINPSAINNLNLKKEKITGQSIYEVLSHNPKLLEIIKEKTACKKEVECFSNNETRFFEATIAAIENKNKLRLGWVLQIYEITERKKEEEQLKLDKENALLLYENAEENAFFSELGFLQAQIRPHFLYNTLNVIATLCRIEPEKARELLMDLSNYMHHCFGINYTQKYISFEEELEFVKAYVRIEQARFVNKIAVNYEIQEAEGLMIPPLLLQPLVENAVRHGIRKNEGGGTIDIRVVNKDSFYHIEIEDNGEGMTSEKLEEIQIEGKTEGVGLANIKKRLKMIYNSELIIESSESKGTKISINLPRERGGIYEGSNC